MEEVKQTKEEKDLVLKEEKLKEWFGEIMKKVTVIFGGDCFLLFEVKKHEIVLKSVASDIDKMSFTLEEINQKKKELAEYIG